MIPPQLYLYGLAVLLTLGLLGGVYAKGRSDANANCDERVTALLAESLERERHAQQRAINATTQLEAARGRTEVKYRTITKEVERVVERPVYSTVCFDVDGVRLANAALAGSSSAPGKFVNTMPAFANPGRR